MPNDDDGQDHKFRFIPLKELDRSATFGEVATPLWPSGSRSTSRSTDACMLFLRSKPVWRIVYVWPCARRSATFHTVGPRKKAIFASDKALSFTDTSKFRDLYGSQGRPRRIWEAIRESGLTVIQTCWCLWVLCLKFSPCVMPFRSILPVWLSTKNKIRVPWCTFTLETMPSLQLSSGKPNVSSWDRSVLWPSFCFATCRTPGYL